MAQLDPQTVAERWAQRLGQAQEKMRSGAMSVTVAPQQKAAAAADTWLARLNDPATKQKFVNSLQRSTLSDWQNAYTQVGLSRIAAGATAATPKFSTFLQSFLPFVNGVATRVRAMPKNTLEDRINRMVAQVRGTAAYKRGQ